MSAKRMSKEERRRQLLEVAYAIVRDEGTDALTLARVAERAGVTKPIAYEHFGSRSGLLIAMYQDYDERQTTAMREALAAQGHTVEGVASVLSAAYVDCAISSGPEMGAITAALSGTEEMERLLQSCRESFSEECVDVFSRFVALPRSEGQAIMVGVLGAAEALSQAAAAGRMTRDEAVSTLAHLMASALAAPRAVKEPAA